MNCATLIYVKRTRNVTLALPVDLLRRARILAVQRDTSVSRLLADLLEELVESESGFALARQRSMARLEQELALGTKGRVGWARDDLHER